MYLAALDLISGLLTLVLPGVANRKIRKRLPVSTKLSIFLSLCTGISPLSEKFSHLSTWASPAHPLMSSTHSIRRLPPQCMPAVIHPPLGLQSPLLAPNPDHCIVMVSSSMSYSPQCSPLVDWGWLIISMPNILPRGAPIYLVCKASGHMCAMLSSTRQAVLQGNQWVTGVQQGQQ